MAYTLDENIDEMHRHVRTVAALAPEGNRETALRFAASVLRMPYSRIKKYFYLEARNVPAHEADKIRAYVKAAQELIEARGQYEALRQQYLAASADNPNALRRAPGALPRTQTVADAEAVVARHPLTKAARSSDDGGAK